MIGCVNYIPLIAITVFTLVFPQRLLCGEQRPLCLSTLGVTVFS